MHLEGHGPVVCLGSVVVDAFLCEPDSDDLERVLLAPRGQRELHVPIAL